MMMMMMMMNLQPSISFKNKVIVIEHLGAKYTGPAFLSPLPSNRFKELLDLKGVERG
jgi:hypothetical protein